MKEISRPQISRTKLSKSRQTGPPPTWLKRSSTLPSNSLNRKPQEWELLGLGIRKKNITESTHQIRGKTTSKATQRAYFIPLKFSSRKNTHKARRFQMIILIFQKSWKKNSTISFLSLLKKTKKRNQARKKPSPKNRFSDNFGIIPLYFNLLISQLQLSPF